MFMQGRRATIHTETRVVEQYREPLRRIIVHIVVLSSITPNIVATSIKRYELQLLQLAIDISYWYNCCN